MSTQTIKLAGVLADLDTYSAGALSDPCGVKDAQGNRPELDHRSPSFAWDGTCTDTKTILAAFHEASVKELEAHFEDVLTLVGVLHPAAKWSLYDAAPADRWSFHKEDQSRAQKFWLRVLVTLRNRSLPPVAPPLSLDEIFGQLDAYSAALLDSNDASVKIVLVAFLAASVAELDSKFEDVLKLVAVLPTRSKCDLMERASAEAQKFWIRVFVTLRNRSLPPVAPPLSLDEIFGQLDAYSAALLDSNDASVKIVLVAFLAASVAELDSKFEDVLKLVAVLPTRSKCDLMRKASAEAQEFWIRVFVTLKRSYSAAAAV